MERITTSEEAHDHLQRITNTDFLGRTIRSRVTSNPTLIVTWIVEFYNYITHRYFSLYKARRLIVGLGVQWTPGTNSADTLQLCFGLRCLVIQLNHTPSIPSILRRLLNDENILFVGIWNRFDAVNLRNNEHHLHVRNLIDIGDSVYTGGNWRPTVENLAMHFLGCDGVRNREVERSDWGSRYLTLRQIHYAVLDAYVSFRIGRMVPQAFFLGYYQCPYCDNTDITHYVTAYHVVS